MEDTRAYVQFVPGRRILHRYPVFDIGEITDSAGNKYTYSREDLQGIKTAFEQNHPEDIPIVLGHVSNQTASKVAKALDIPAIILNGEGKSQKGAARLGEITALYVEEDSKLTGDVALHPKVAKLVDEGFFTDVSVEIMPTKDKEFPLIMSRMALLGGQRPAVKTLGSHLQDYEESEHSYITKLDYEEWSVPFKNGLFSRNYEDVVEGVVEVPPKVATSGIGGLPWTVPMRFAGGGRIEATVSAADAISAKSVAYRVVENFLLNFTGPLGKILGGAVGTVLGAKILVGKPILGSGPSKIGKIAYKFVKSTKPNVSMRVSRPGKSGWKRFLPFEEFSEQDEVEIIHQIENTIRQEYEEQHQQNMEQLQEKISLLEHQVLAQHFYQELQELNYIPGTPQELGNRLATVSRQYGEEEANNLLRLWRVNNEKTYQENACALILSPTANQNYNPIQFEEYLSNLETQEPELSPRDRYIKARKEFYSK